jgi:hypothetical protein
MSQYKDANKPKGDKKPGGCLTYVFWLTFICCMYSCAKDNVAEFSSKHEKSPKPETSSVSDNFNYHAQQDGLSFSNIYEDNKFKIILPADNDNLKLLNNTRYASEQSNVIAIDTAKHTAVPNSYALKR